MDVDRINRVAALTGNSYKKMHCSFTGTKEGRYNELTVLTRCGVSLYTNEC